MASKKGKESSTTGGGQSISSSVDALFAAAAERGSQGYETGRHIITYRQDAGEEALKSLKSRGINVADARDFKDQAVALGDVGDADALHFPEIGSCLVSGDTSTEHGFSVQSEHEVDSPIETIEPEYFVFANNSEYLRGFLRAAETIAKDLGSPGQAREHDEKFDAEVFGATWGLNATKVPPSVRSGAGIRVAILDTGFDLNHPDFAGRPITTQTFVGQPVQDLNGHGTHTTGTATGPRAPGGTTPRYGIAFASRIFVGKVLTNAGSGTTATVLAGINWAIANQAEVISMSLGAQIPVQASYTAAGNAALAKGLLLIAAAGNAGAATGAPANSPSILSVASLDSNLSPSSYSNFGKVDIAGPGRDVFSSSPLPRRYATLSGTSMATPHVAGIAALWAQSNPSLRGINLWRRLQSASRSLPFPTSRVGSGLVQAP